MKKTLCNALALFIALPFLTQCASTNDIEELRYQLRVVNRKIEDMKTTTVPLQQRQAAASGQLDQMERELLELKGQLEETKYLNQKLKEHNKELETSISTVAQEEAAKREEALKKFEDDLREKEAKLAEKLNQQQESVKAIQEARLKEAERKAKEAALMADLAKKKTQKAATTVEPEAKKATASADKKKEKKEGEAPAPAAASTSDEGNKKAAAPAVKESPPAPAEKQKAPPAAADSGDGNMQKAMRLYEKNAYAEALPLFEKVASAGSSGESVEARYMMGEVLFSQKEYDKAIMEYQKIISQSSNHPKAPEAMLKQGMAFEKLADKETAKVIYKKLVKKHPSSTESAKAQERLGKL